MSNVVLPRPVARTATLRAATTLANPTRICFTEPVPLDLCSYRGDTGRLRVTITDQDGAPIDVSGAGWDCDVRTDHDAPGYVATLDTIPVAGQPNAVDLILPAPVSADMTAGTYVWDLEMRLGGEVQTLLAGTFTVDPDVSRP